MKYSKWLARLGSTGYDLLILLNGFANLILTATGSEKISFSKRIKHSVKKAVTYINKFEETAAEIAITKHYDYVICGHIHQPEIRHISNGQGEVIYMNAGDWVENLSSLEFHKGEWRIYTYQDDHFATTYAKASHQVDSLSNKETFEQLLREFHIQ
jgi:UDP-2,3-diacylglucosamine pyrophosphatase LpxH